MTSVPTSRRALLRACARLSAVSALAAIGALPLAAQAEEVLRVSAIPDEAQPSCSASSPRSAPTWKPRPG